MSAAVISDERFSVKQPVDVDSGPPNDGNRNHTAKIVVQAKALGRVLKEHFGFGTVFGLIAVFISLAGPVAYQSKTNGANAVAIDNLAKAQEKSKDEQSRALTEAVTRIESGINRAIDLALQNREDMRSMKDDVNRRVDKIETLSQSNWNKMVEVSNRMGIVEAKQERKKEN